MNNAFFKRGNERLFVWPYDQVHEFEEAPGLDRELRLTRLLRERFEALSAIAQSGRGDFLQGNLHAVSEEIREQFAREEARRASAEPDDETHLRIKELEAQIRQNASDPGAAVRQLGGLIALVAHRSSEEARAHRDALVRDHADAIQKLRATLDSTRRRQLWFTIALAVLILVVAN